MKDKILSSAQKIFSRKGYYKTTMDEIMVDAGVAKGSLYYHFTNKSQLFREVVLNGIDWLFGEINSVVMSGIPDREKIHLIIEKNVDIIFDYSELLSIIMNEISSGIDADVLEDIRKAKDKYINFIAGFLRDGRQEGIFKSCDYEAAANGIVHFIYSYQKQAADRGETDRKKICDGIYEVLMRGLLVNG